MEHPEIKPSRFLAAVFLFSSAASIAISVPAKPPTPLFVLSLFAYRINHGEYRKAFSLFSKPLQNEVSFEEFEEGAKRVKSVRLVSAGLFVLNQRVAKARLVMEGLQKDAGESTWHKQRYSGWVVFIPEKGYWRLIQVELDSTHHKKFMGGNK